MERGILLAVMRKVVRRLYAGLRRRLPWALVYALLFSLLPWTPPNVTPAVERAFSNAPTARWAAPLALSVSGWADRSLSALRLGPVYAGTNITLTLSKRDDGDSLGWSPGVGPDPVIPGATFVYYIQVTNTGSVSATVYISEELPSGLECGGSPGAVPGYEGGTNTSWFGSCADGIAQLFTGDAIAPPIGPIGEGLPAGASAVLYILATVSSPLPDGAVITNTRDSYGAYATQEPAYNYTGTNAVTTTVYAPRLVISKTASPDPVEAGDELTFTVVVANGGSYTLTAPFTLTVVDNLDAATNYVRHTLFPGPGSAVVGTAAITWTVPVTSDMLPGDSLTATLVLTVDVPFTHTWPITNAIYSVSITPTGRVTPPTAYGEPVPVIVHSHPSLTITKESIPQAVYANQSWSYRITVTNAPDAQGDAVGLIITERVPISTVLESVSYEIAGTTVVSEGTAPGSLVTWTLPADYALFWGHSTCVTLTVRAASSVVVSGTVVTNTSYGVTAANSLLAVNGEPVTTTLWGAPRLYAIKEVTPTVITAANGESDVVTFTITVTNLAGSTAAATGVIVTDTVPAATELTAAGFVSGTGTVISSGVAAGSVITWQIADPIAPGSSIALTFTAHISTPVDNNTTTCNQAAAFSAEGEYTTTNQVCVTIHSTPTLQILKIESSDPISADGSMLTYTIYYSNVGTMNAYNTVLTDTLPDHVAFVSATPGHTPSSPAAGQTLSWNLGTVWGSGVATLVLTIATPITNGTVLTNHAAIYCDGDKRAESDPITTTVRSWPILSLTKTEVGGNDPISAGMYLTYSLLIANAGYDWARDLVITDVIPENTTLISTSLRSQVAGTTMISSGIAAGETITWALPSDYRLDVGGTVGVTFTVLVHSWLTNSMRITNTTYGVTASNALTAVAGPPEPTTISSYPRLGVSKSVQPPSVIPGGVVTYTITIVNTGNDSSRSTTVTDSLPAGITYGGMLDGPVPSATNPERWSGLYITGAITRVTGYTPTVYHLVFTATVDGTASEGEYTNCVTVTDQYAEQSVACQTLDVYYPNLLVSKSASPATHVEAGSVLTYTIVYTNDSPTPAHGVIVTDFLPQHISGGGSDRAYAGTIDDGNLITWTIGTLDGYATGQIVLTITVDNPLTPSTVLTNVVGITSVEGIGSASGPVTVTVTSQPALAIAKSDLNDPVDAGATITYHIRYTNTNAGNANATGVLISDTLAAYIAGGWASPAPNGSIVAGGTITWDIGLLPRGAGGVITLVLTTTSSIANGTVLTNRVSITCAEGVSASAHETTTIASAPLLQISKADEADPVQAGAVISYTITYTNSGNGPATNVVISDQLPTDISGGWANPAPNSGTFAPGNTLVWNIGTLNGGGAAGTIHLYLTTTAPLDAPVMVTDRVTIAATGGYSAAALAETTITCSPEVTIVKRLSQATARPGDVLTYTITITNAGNQNVTGGLLITDLLATELTVVDKTASSGSVVSATVGGRAMVTWTLASLAGLGGTGQLVLNVQVTRPLTDGYEIPNVAWASYGATIIQSEPVTLVVHSSPDITVTKAVAQATAAPGDLLTYTIMVTNVGDALAYGVTITDLLPAHTTFITANSGGVSITVGSQVMVSWTLDMPALDVGYTRVFTVQLTTPLTDGLAITNTAWVSHSGTITESNVVTTMVASEAILHITKAESSDPVGAGGLLTYTILYSTTGNGIATDTTITDTLDANVTLISTDPLSTTMAGQQVIWNLGSLYPDGPHAITVVVLISPTLPDGTLITNTAEIRGGGSYTTTGPVTTTVRAADIAISKSVTPTLVRPDELVTYTIVFSNVGGAAANAVQITDSLPISLTLVSSDTLGATFATGGGHTYTWVSATVEPGSVGMITITARLTTADGWIAPTGVAITNTAVADALLDNTPANDTALTPVTAIAGQAATVTLAIVPTTTQVPGPATILITVTDRYGNLVYDGDGYTVTIATSPTGAGLGANPLNIGGGIASTTISSTIARTYDLTAALGSAPMISATGQVTFTAGPLDHFVISHIGDQVAGISFTVDITAVDQYTNVVTSFESVVQLEDTATPNTLQPPTSAPFVGGVLSGQYVTITLARVNSSLRVLTGTVSTASNPFTVTAGPPRVITVTTDAITIPLDVNSPVTATVKDAYGNPAAGAVLTFGITPVGTLNPPTADADADGRATFAISSTATGRATVVVTAANGITGSAVVTFIAGLPAAITVTVVPSYQEVGNAATIQITVTDAHGNPVDWESVTLGTPDPLGGGSIAPTSIHLDANGTATASISSTLLYSKTVVVTATSNSLTGTGLVTFTVGPAQQVLLTMTPNPQQVGVNATLVATVTDRYGNPRAGDVVTFSVAAGALGGGSISPITDTTNASGQATASISSTLATVTIVTATVAGTAPPVSDTAVVTFTAGPPHQITVTVSPTAVEGGVNATLVATVTDRYGNPCAGEAITFTTASGALGSGGIVPAIATADANGVATAQVSGTIPGAVVITATADTTISATTVLTVTSGLLDHLMTSYVADQTAGVNFTLHITAVDALGNPRSDSGTVYIADASGTVQPTSVALVGGRATVAISITRAMVNDQITVTWQADPAVMGTTNLFTVTAGAPATITLTASPQAIAPGGNDSTLVATVKDTYGNPVSGRTVNFAAVSGPTVTLNPNSGTTDASGQVTITLTSGQDQGTVTVEATCDGLTARVDVLIRTFMIYMPLVMRNYTGVDLQLVGDIQVIPDGNGNYEVRVTVTNVGPRQVTADFWVDLYLDPDPTVPITVNVLWHNVCEQGKAWYVRADLDAGEQIVLSTNDPDDPANPDGRYSNWVGDMGGAGDHTLWVQVDSYGLPDIGAVIEYDESNNLGGPTAYHVATAAQESTPPPLDIRPTPAP